MTWKKHDELTDVSREFLLQSTLAILNHRLAGSGSSFSKIRLKYSSTGLIIWHRLQPGCASDVDVRRKQVARGCEQGRVQE